MATLDTRTRGNIVIPEQVTDRTTVDDAVERAVTEVAARRAAWVGVGVPQRIGLLDRLIADTAAVADRWAAAECERKGIAPGSPVAGEEWFLGPSLTLRMMRLLRNSLVDIEREGRPRLPGRPRVGSDGQAIAPIVPAGAYDRLLFTGISAEVWMQPEVAVDDVEATIGGIYRLAPAERTGRVCAVLGAGNVSSIPATDILTKIFAEDQVVVAKPNPITDHLGEIFERALGALVEGGWLRFVYGGHDQAHRLIHHPAVDTVHMTGSDKTYDAIVFGGGPDGARRKAENRPLLDKPVTAELGNVTPTIVVPGPWSRRDMTRQAEFLATTFAHGAGFECINTRVLVTAANWDRRPDLLDAFRATMRRLPHRRCFYPGAEERYDAFVQAHPEAERLGEGGPGTLPWALIPAVDPASDDLVFRTDPFTCVMSETGLESRSVADFVDRAVEFCNDRVWGSLGAGMVVHPRSLRDPAVAAAVRRAVRDLRFGAVAVNTGCAMGFALMSPPWGAFPGNPPDDIGSGRGFVHNCFMLAQPQKTVVTAPFHGVPPRPPYLVTHPREDQVLSRVTYFEADPGPRRLPGIFWHTLRGAR